MTARPNFITLSLDLKKAVSCWTYVCHATRAAGLGGPGHAVRPGGQAAQPNYCHPADLLNLNKTYASKQALGHRSRFNVCNLLPVCHVIAAAEPPSPTWGPIHAPSDPSQTPGLVVISIPPMNKNSSLSEQPMKSISVVAFAVHFYI